MQKVFVYGTLKRGFGNHRLLSKSTFLGEHTTSPDFTMLSCGGYPAIFKGGATKIIGEVYEVDEATLRNLDYLEGYPDFYSRDQILTPYGRAWVYYWEQDLVDNHALPVVESGCWGSAKHYD